MADSGELDPETLVWRSGMEQWTPGSWVAELRFPVTFSAAQGDAGAGVAPAPGVIATRTSVLAISSLVMGLFWMFGLGSASAIVLSVMSLRQIARSQGTLTGKRLAIAGMIVGIVGLIISGIILRGFILKDRWQD